MKTKNIFKTLALAMLMPTMLLTTACSSEDDVVNSNTANIETVANKGYALPVTVNVTREGDATMRASYNGTSRKLEFTTGDKLFVKGNDYSAGGTGFFAGTLTWQSGGTFSGTILTEKEYTGTIDALFAKGSALATLLPANYGSYPYLSFDNEGTYSASINFDATKTFATSKATAVEQFSYEVGGYTSGTGFALHPANAILNFTITSLATNTGVDVAFKDNTNFTISGNVTTNVSGTATFAIGVYGDTDLNEFSLTVGGKSITLVSSSKVLAAGKIYNINRDVATDLSTINANYTAQNGETLTGTLASNVKISIANGATVTLNNVTIDGEYDELYKYAGITCVGDATIILSGTNTVKGFYSEYPGIYVPEGKKLTIKGSGSLTASSNGYGAGIGGCWGISCGNIEIPDGVITATGGYGCAGIGSGNGSACGTITISGGTVTATGGNSGAGIGSGNAIATCGTITISGGTVEATGGKYGAGIGSGFESACGTINIASTVIKVTATKGTDAPYSIGKGGGLSSSCGTVTIEDPSKVTQN